MTREILKLKKLKTKPVSSVKKVKTPPPLKIKSKILTEQMHALLRLLKANHPDLFPRDGGSPKPWKIHLRRDVKRRYNVTNKVSKVALAFWRKRHHELYTAALIPGASRYDLDGKIAGIVEKAWVDISVAQNQRLSSV